MVATIQPGIWVGSLLFHGAVTGVPRGYWWLAGPDDLMLSAEMVGVHSHSVDGLLERKELLGLATLGHTLPPTWPCLGGLLYPLVLLMVSAGHMPPCPKSVSSLQGEGAGWALYRGGRTPPPTVPVQ